MTCDLRRQPIAARLGGFNRRNVVFEHEVLHCLVELQTRRASGDAGTPRASKIRELVRPAHSMARRAARAPESRIGSWRASGNAHRRQLARPVQLGQAGGRPAGPSCFGIGEPSPPSLRSKRSSAVAVFATSRIPPPPPQAAPPPPRQQSAMTRLLWMRLGTAYPAQPSFPACCETGRPILGRTSGLAGTAHIRAAGAFH